MNKEEIFELIKKYIKIIMPELKSNEINLNDSFEILGFNSLEKMEITTKIISELSLTISAAELFRQANLAALVDLLEKKIKEKIG
ncbi:MAG: hypothetical protein J0M23_04595 [Rickettsiales bacterium]|nr:hypothetical protein [Rickettsiales bacterium]